jgi:lon-related putative ATP-dependent protease
MPIDPLPPEALFTRCDAAAFDFATTDELAEIEESLGQGRAVEAVQFGIAMDCPGYNMFALGPPGAGKHAMVRRHLKEAAASAAPPSDWAYVNNFEEPHKPKVLELPTGRGWPLRDDMEKLVSELREAIPAMFESDAYRARRETLDEEFKSLHEKSFEEVQARAKEKNIAIMRTHMGLAMAPLRDGEVLDPEAFHKLPEEEQAKTKRDIEELEQQLQEVMRKAPQWQRTHREKLRALNREMTEYVVGHLIDDLRKRYADLPKVVSHIDAVRRDVIENARDFVPQEQPEGGDAAEAMARRGGPGVVPGGGDAAFRRYQVNVIVDRGGAEAAPVIYEDHPTHPNLIGRIEHIAQFGALLTDFNLIKPGALLRANGGYLILDALKVLQQPYAWEELKRALRSGEVRVEGLGEQLGIISTVSLKPEPIRLDVKVVLLGDRQLYYLLAEHDPDFRELFKVAVDFDDVVDRTGTNTRDYARMIATLARRDRLRPLDAGAVARVIEHAARMVGDSEKLSARVRLIADLLHEADHFAGRDSAKVTTAVHVQRAIDAQIRRGDRLRERIQEQINRGTVMIDTDGAAVGQLNGLSVLQLGGFAFGQPSRITARVRMGRGEVVDIEREVELGGPLHSKGVLILSGYLGQKFARERPLALSASLVFEQSYGGVDGDSASSAELYALLSALSGVPIAQGFAVTGSVNQHGRVQPIGGANEKIEGFFDICRARGLDGSQGVLIPAANVKHLMLHADVVAAAEAGQFRIFAVDTIDQGIEILTGMAAGAPGDDGAYPADTVNGRVQAQLDAFADKALRYAAVARGEDK